MVLLLCVLIGLNIQFIKMKRAFWFHYNKPASQQKKKPQITIHYKGACHIVDNLECDVPTKGRLRNQQPRWVVAGKCENIEFVDGIAKIYQKVEYNRDMSEEIWKEVGIGQYRDGDRRWVRTVNENCWVSVLDRMTGFGYREWETAICSKSPDLCNIIVGDHRETLSEMGEDELFEWYDQNIDGNREYYEYHFGSFGGTN